MNVTMYQTSVRGKGTEKMGYPGAAKDEIPFEIFTAAEYQQMHLNKPCRLKGMEIVWIRKNSGSIFVDGIRDRLEENAVCILTPGLFRILEWQANPENLIIHFSSDFLNTQCNKTLSLFFSGYYGNFTQLPILEMDRETVREMQELLMKMKNEFNRGNLARSDILQSLLHLYLLYLASHIGFPPMEIESNNHKSFVNKYIVQVREGFKKSKSVSDYARHLCVTPKYLNAVVKRVSGLSASHHIKQCIITEAKNMALFTELSMKEIADELGFGDTSHFSKFFKNAMGINFRAFKKKQLFI